MKVIARLLMLFLLTALLAGCGVRTVYNNIDRLTLRWVDNQVSLDAEQSRIARDMIDRHLDWHCASELPDYAEWLRRLDADIGDDRVSVEILEHHADTMSAFWRRLLDTVRPSMIEMIVHLNDEQLEELRESFEERNLELAERAGLDAEERGAERVKAMERGLRRFLGRLGREQRRRLEQWAAELTPADESTLNETLRWQDTFFDLVEHRHEPDFDLDVRPLLDPGGNWSSEHLELMAHNRERTLEALVDILQGASDRQISRLRSRLTSFADDFDRLTCL